MGTATANPLGGLRREPSQWLGPTLLAIVFLTQLWFTWQRWPDVLIDFGRELYVPWQIHEGAVLYRDIAYFHGPFSPHFNALLFCLFGTSLLTLALANVLLLAGLLAMVYLLVARATSRVAATVACLVMLGIFCFSQFGQVGNYNFITPYSHELTHGVFFSFLMFWLMSCGNCRKLLAERTTRGDVCRNACAGLAWGVVFLGKAEVFLAATCCAATLLGAPLLLGCVNKRVQWCRSAAFLCGGLASVTAFVVALSQTMPIRDSLVYVSGSWQWIGDSSLRELPFYQRLFGFDQVGHNAAQILGALGQVVAMLAVLALVDVALRRRWSMPLAFASVVCALIAHQRFFPAVLVGGATLPLVTLMLAAAAVHTWKSRHDDGQVGRMLPLLAWMVFGIALLARMMLRPRFVHYGFALAMPATVLTAAILVWAIPLWLKQHWQGGKLFRVAIVTLLVLDAAGYFRIAGGYLEEKTLPVGAGGDMMLAKSDAQSDVGIGVQQLLDHINTNLSPEATFVVLPEGISVNYQTKRRNPTRYVNFMPPEVLMFGEAAMLENLRSTRPDYVILIHKDTTEYGMPRFGVDYGRAIMKWAQSEYLSERTFLNEPLVGDKFGIQLRRRRVPTGGDTAGAMASLDPIADMKGER